MLSLASSASSSLHVPTNILRLRGSFVNAILRKPVISVSVAVSGKPYANDLVVTTRINGDDVAVHTNSPGDDCFRVIKNFPVKKIRNFNLLKERQFETPNVVLRDTAAMISRFDETSNFWGSQSNTEKKAFKRKLKVSNCQPQIKAKVRSENSQHGENSNAVAKHGNKFPKFTSVPLPVKDEQLKSIDKKLMDHVFPFQNEGIKFILSRRGRAILADEMGLGKTIQALGAAHYYHRDWPLLIVCPAVLRMFWAKCMEDWLPSVSPNDVFIVKTSSDPLPIQNTNAVVITSYDQMVALQQQLHNIKFGVTIVDESHMIKEVTTQRTQAALELLSKSKRRILLTGTPALSRPAELFTQVEAVDQSVLGSWDDFLLMERSALCTKKYEQFLDSVKDRLLETVMLRRRKEDVLSVLPSKVRHYHVLDMSFTQSDRMKLEMLKNECQHLRQRVALTRGENRWVLSDFKAALSSYFAATANVKFASARKFMLEQLEKGHKCIVFAHHISMIDNLAEALHEINVQHIKIIGETTDKKRCDLMKVFQDSDQCRVAVLGIRAAGVGVSLTAANCVIFAELYYTPGALLQAEDRAHRIGQNSELHVHYLVAKNTMDDYLWSLVESKFTKLNQLGICMSLDEFKGVDCRR